MTNDGSGLSKSLLIVVDALAELGKLTLLEEQKTTSLANFSEATRPEANYTSAINTDT